ncbi:myelin-associated glycoprotein-like [Chiloscyllium plagiosum]|uniref:myelin-associated glycoprotein-like n=1 Tax=Chiloscyllium plagiosum TaxID=36176 RepID=UPI001CB8281A|nr:myelin-associated glycoprotein-like [Chiloscyllium plagiosum]XP_043539180.1 myelin-associated glycoprotein-like [Chiloscyllium plagiosum]
MGRMAVVLITLRLLSDVATEEWTMTTSDRKAISGSCVVIPCTFDFPSHTYKAVHGAWFKYWYSWKYTIAYSKDPNYRMSIFVGRTDIIGDLEQKDCSLKIDNLRPEDSDNYYFYVDVKGFDDHTFTKPIQLQVLDAPDRPKMLLPEDIKEGTLVHIICKALHTCPDNPPKLTWSQLPSSSVSDTIESGDEISTVLTFNPSYRHHNQIVHCTCVYPQTNHRVFNSVTLSVKYSPHNTSVRMTTGKGKTVSLICSSDGNPAVHRFNWFKISKGNVTNLTLSGQTITVPYGFEVEISYYCVATNSLGSSQSLPVHIPTEYSPRNTSVRMTTGKGKTISLSCSSDGNPAVHRFNWFKISEGNVTNLTLSGQTITVPYGFEVEISYYCVATNSLGSSQSLPVHIPTEYGAVILPESRCTQYQTYIICLCLVQTNSTVNVTWALPDGSTGETGSDGIYEAQSVTNSSLMTNTLTIRGGKLFEGINCSIADDGGGRPLQRLLEIQSDGRPVGMRWELIQKYGLVAAGGAVLLITSPLLIYFIVKARKRRDKPRGNGIKQTQKANSTTKSELMSVRPKQTEKCIEAFVTRAKVNQRKDDEGLEMKSNLHPNSNLEGNLYENYQWDQDLVYTNI